MEFPIPYYFSKYIVHHMSSRVYKSVWTTVIRDLAVKIRDSNEPINHAVVGIKDGCIVASLSLEHKV